MTTTNRAEGESADIERYGIVRVQTEHFTWGGYRYSNARDALAAAKRGAAQ